MTTEIKESRYKVGDQRYYVPGVKGSDLIVIRCTVKVVDDDGWYWLDEPIGHSVHEEEMLCRDDAIIEMMSRFGIRQDDGGRAQLSAFRQKAENSITSSQTHPGFPLRPDKEPWVEWVNPQMILDKRTSAIKGAAIKFDGKVYWVPATGRHNHVFHKIMRENPELKNCHGNEQGFVTQDDVFVDRIEGARIAIESGQIEKLSWPPHLYSEDLW